MNINASNSSSTNLYNMAFGELKKNKEAASATASQVAQTPDNSSNITQKMLVGTKLTAQDLDYLSQNNAKLYEKAEKVQAERKSIKSQFAGAKSKQEVQSLYSQKSLQFYTEFKSLENASMSAEERQDAIEDWRMRHSAFEDERKDFYASGTYNSLPATSDTVSSDKISMKLASGGKITDKEMLGLSENNSELYEKAEKIQAERQLLRSQFSMIQNKTDMRTLESLKMMEYWSSFKKIEQLPSEERDAAMELWNMQYKAFEDEKKNLHSSAAYRAMPAKGEQKGNDWTQGFSFYA